MSKFLAIHVDPVAGCTFFIVQDVSGALEARFCTRVPVPHCQEVAIQLLKENQISSIKIMKRNNYPDKVIEELSSIPGVILEVME